MSHTEEYYYADQCLRVHHNDDWSGLATIEVQQGHDVIEEIEVNAQLLKRALDVGIGDAMDSTTFRWRTPPEELPDPPNHPDDQRVFLIGLEQTGEVYAAKFDQVTQLFIPLAEHLPKYGVEEVKAWVPAYEVYAGGLSDGSSEYQTFLDEHDEEITPQSPPGIDQGIFEKITKICGRAEDAPAGPEILEECLAVAEMLIRKNRQYGSSAFDPVRVFSDASPTKQIDVRMDDKLSRIQADESDDMEDAEMDLLGYLVLKRIKQREGDDE